MKKLWALGGIASVLLPWVTTIANAAPPPAVYKTADGEVIWHSGLSANQQVDVDYPNIPAKRKIKANFCGIVVVPNSATQPIGASLKVGTDTITVSTLPVQTMPRCENNVLAESRPANFKLANGNVAVVGKTAGISYDVEFVGSSHSKSFRANNCGFLVIRPTAALPIGSSIVLNGTTHTVSSLVTEKEPVCRNDSGAAVRYDPASW